MVEKNIKRIGMKKKNLRIGMRIKKELITNEEQLKNVNELIDLI